MNKTNNGKLLAAIVAMAMIVCAVAVIATPLNAAPGDSTEPYDLDGPVTVTNADGEVVEDVDTLAKAIGQTSVTGAQTWTLAANAYYNVTKTVGESIGSGLVIPFANITLNGNGATVYADVASDTSAYDSSNKMNMQSMLTIVGEGVTVKNLTVMTMYVPDSDPAEGVTNGWSVYKSIEVDGQNAVIDGVKLVENKLAAGYSTATIDYPGYGGSIVPTVSGTTIKNCNINNGNINCAYLSENATLNVENTKITIESDFVYGFNAHGYEAEEPSTTTVTYNVKSTTVEVNSEDANATDVINGTPAGATIAINAPVTLTDNTEAKADVIFGPKGSIDKGNFSFTGNTGIDNATELGNTIEGSLSIPNASYLVNSITVKEGGALIIQKGAYLNLMGQTLTLNGTLTIEKGATVVDSLGGGSIKIVGKGVINNDGIIGEGNAVTVSSDYGSVTLKDISGIVFTTEKKVVEEGGANVVKYVLDVSGTIEAEAKTGSSIGFDTANGIEDGVLINADTEIRKDVTATGAVTVKGGATLTLNGDSAGLTVTMLNNSTVKVNAGVGSIEALTGEYKTFDENGDRVTIGDSTDGIDTSSVTMSNVYGITVKVTSKVYDKTGADGKAISYTEQMMSVSGALSLIDSKTVKTGTVDITGDVYILSGETLSAGKEITVSNSEGSLITEGKAVIIAGTDPEITYKGTMYVQSTEGSSDKTYTYTNFTDAFANIEAADDKTVTLMGGYEFTGTVTIADGQVVEFTDDAKYTIAADATVIVQNGGELSESFATGDDKGIKGVLTVMDGGDCEPVEGSYEVLSTDAEDNITYSSAQTAIKNAVSGTTVDIVDGAILKDAATVVSGVTVNVHDGVNLQAQKGLTVAEGGKVVNEGTITVSDKYDLTVAGEVDSIDGTITLGGSESEMTVTGTVSYPTKMTAGVNAAVYVNEDHYVYTTVAKAVTAVAAMDIAVPIDALGTFSESGTVTLTEDMELNIVGKQITLGTVVLETGADLNVNADSKLTATVSGACGTDGTASVALSKVEGISFTETFNSSTSVAALVMSSVYSGTEPTLVQELAGTVTVSAGTVTVDGTMTFDGVDNILVVSSGAVIAVPENSAIVADKNDDGKVAVTVEGTMDLAEGTFTVNTGAFAAVSGTVNVSESGPSTGLVVTGTLTVTGTVAVSDVEGEEGTLKITGVLALGDKPTTIGAAGVVTGPVKLEGNGYIKAYNGADLTGADINVGTDGESDAVSTTFNINGWLYMTVYALDGVEISDGTSGVLDNEKFDLVGYVTKDDTDNNKININEIQQWYTDAELTDKATADAKVGDPSALYFKANAAEVRVDISVGEGISLYIDGIKQSGSYNILKVGTHTVTATVNPGFKGDVTITFNGQTISGGEFTITPEMASATYDDAIVVSASGNITTDSTVVIDGGSSGDGMGLTDYLLIILVILIVVMAIMVAMRLMRS